MFIRPTYTSRTYCDTLRLSLGPSVCLLAAYLKKLLTDLKQIMWNDKPSAKEEDWRTYPPGSEPPVSGKAGRNPQDITPCSIRTQCTMSFSVTGKGGSES